MWLTCQVPELILCGLPVEDAASIINAIGARAADGVDITPETVLDDVCPTPLAFRPVDLSWRKTRLMTVSDALLRHGQGAVPAGRLVGRGRAASPGNAGFPRGFERLQPMLWLPRDDNPPSPGPAWSSRAEVLRTAEEPCEDDAYEQSGMVQRSS